jgi:glutamate-1-semialdehyde-2,1-aminomutase
VKPSTVDQARYRASLEIARASAGVLPVIAPEVLALPVPICIQSAAGARLVDVDGNEYVDLLMGLGPLVLGHAPQVVLDAIGEAARDGLQYVVPNRWQEPFARLIVEEVPCAERVLFCNSGTEATMYAMRALRAVSGRTKIAVFEGSYHGAHDYALARADADSPLDAPTVSPRKAGVPDEVMATMTMLPYWSDAAFDLIRAQAGELAGVMVEPAQGANPQDGQVEWLRELREVCREAGVPILFDEVITGFRMGPGGAQAAFGVVPDIATYGKVLGGGLPIGAVAGRADIMETFAKHAPGTYPADREAFTTGTFSANPMSMAAGFAAISHLRENPRLYTHLRSESDRLVAAVNAFCDAEDIPAHMNQCDSMFLLYFGRLRPARTVRELQRAQAEPGPSGQPLSVAADAFFGHLFDAGVLGLGLHHMHLSTAHSREDVDFAIDAMKRSFLAVRAAGLC